MRGKNYIEIGRTGKFFDPKNKKTVDSLVMFSGYKANFQMLENGLNLRVDVAKKFVRQDTVKRIIDELYARNRDLPKEQKRDMTKNELIGQTVMTNYGKPCYYRIEDVLFEPMEDVILSVGEEEMNIRDYYRKKYNVDFDGKQPLLLAENKNKRLVIFKIYLGTSNQTGSRVMSDDWNSLGL